MFLVNSRLGLFTATLSRSISKLLHGTRVPLLPKLRGDFAEFLSESCLALLRIFFLPTCGGLRYGLSTISNAKFFLAIWSQHLLVRRLSTSRLTLTNWWIFLPALATRLYSHFQSTACLSSCVPPLLITIIPKYRNINRLSIAYAFQPELRVRLTPRGRACRGKP